MGLFDNMLSSEESLFKDSIALDYDYIPKIVPFREQQQRYIAACIKPLFKKLNGKNLLIYGKAGIGKTVATKHILRELEGETEEIIPIYINCWQKNTSFKIYNEICDILNYKMTHNKKSDELFNVIKQLLNKKSAVFVFDEADKIEEFDFLYALLEEIYRKTILLITNHKEWLIDLDQRIKSRLTSDAIEFKPYNEKETKEILRQRSSYAFVPGVWENNAFELIAKKTFELEDIRTGLYLMKESAISAENKSLRKITLEHAKEALTKLDDFSIKKSSDLEDDTRAILDVIKKNLGKKIGDVFKIYQENGGKSGYKSFQRKIAKLEKNKFIEVTKTEGGSLGNTSIIYYKKPETRKLTEF